MNNLMIKHNSQLLSSPWVENYLRKNYQGSYIAYTLIYLLLAYYHSLYSISGFFLKKEEKESVRREENAIHRKLFINCTSTN